MSQRPEDMQLQKEENRKCREAIKKINACITDIRANVTSKYAVNTRMVAYEKSQRELKSINRKIEFEEILPLGKNATWRSSEINEKLAALNSKREELKRKLEKDRSSDWFKLMTEKTKGEIEAKTKDLNRAKSILQEVATGRCNLDSRREDSISMCLKNAIKANPEPNIAGRIKSIAKFIKAIITLDVKQLANIGAVNRKEKKVRAELNLFPENVMKDKNVGEEDKDTSNIKKTR